MEPIQQLMHMRSQAQRAQLEGWIGLQLPFDDEVLEYLLRLSKLVEPEELSLLVADFCPQWPEGMQLALVASLSPQALRVPWHGGPGSKQILLEPAPCRQERREPERPSILQRAMVRNATGQMPTDIRKAKPMLPEVSRRDEEFSKVTDPIDLQQTIKDIVQEQLALQQRLQRNISPKASKTGQSGQSPLGPLPTSRAASPDPEAEKRQKCTAYRPREHSIQEIINQQLLLQEQLRPLADGGVFVEPGIFGGKELPKVVTSEVGVEIEGREIREVREVKDQSYSQDVDTTATGGFGHWPGSEPWISEDRVSRMESMKDARLVRDEDQQLGLEEQPAVRTSRTLPSRGSAASSSSRHRISTGHFIDVAVSLPNGQTTWQRVRPEATALEVKQRLAEWGFGGPMKLTFLGLRLKDHWRLVDCGVRSHDKLQASAKASPHGRRGGEKRQGAGPIPSSCDPSKGLSDASPHSVATATVEEESRWNAVVSLQQSIETLQETIKTSQQEQKENLTDHRHSLTMLQEQQQQQLKSLHFIEDQQRSLATSAAESSEMKQGLKQVQLEQQKLHARLDQLDRSLRSVGTSKAEMRNSPKRPVEVQEEASPSSSHRRWLILQVFRMLDRDRDGLLQQRELMGLARLMGFNFTEDDWAVEYHDLCRDMSIQPHKGFDPQSFTKLLDSENGCPATDENLFEALIHHCPDKTRATAAVELFERLDLDRDGFLSASELRDWGLEPTEGADHYGRYDLPAFHLLVSALSLEQLRERSRFHAYDADDADLLPSPQVLVDVISPAVSVSPVPSQIASVKSASVTSPGSPEAVESVASPKRSELMAQLFAALDTDQDGKCSSKDLGVVFASRYEAWPMHFRKICSHWNIKQREGVDAETFAEMLQAPGDMGLYVSEEEMEEMLQSIQRRTERRVSTQDRSRLVDALFFYLDANQDGLLHAPELQRLTSELGVQELQLPSVDLDTFRVLVNDRSQRIYCEDTSLPKLLARFSRKG